MKKDIVEEMTRESKSIREELEASGDTGGQFIVPEGESFSVLPEGTYGAVIRNAIFQANLVTKNGTTDAIDIIMDVFIENEEFGSQEKREIRERYFLSKNPCSKFATHLGEVIERDATEGFNTTELIGKLLEIEIKHNKRIGDDRIYANVGKIRLLNDDISEVI